MRKPSFLPQLIVAIVALLVGCSDTAHVNYERVGEWKTSPDMLVEYTGSYFPNFSYEGQIHRWEMCTGFSIDTLQLGETIQLHYREINEYTTLDHPCIQWDAMVKRKR